MTHSIVNVLADSLDAISRGEMTPAECLARFPEYRDELGDLLATAATVQAAPAALPRAEFRRVARARLLNLLPAQPVNRAAGRRWPLLWTRWLARVPTRWPDHVPAAARNLALVALLLLLGFRASTFAWRGALSGDLLYPLKIAVQDARLAVLDEKGEATLRLVYVQDRLREIQALVEGGRYEDLAVAVDGFEGQLAGLTHVLTMMAIHDAVSAQDLAAADQLFSRADLVLKNLLPVIPAGDRPRLTRARDISAEYRGRLSDSFPSYVKLSNR